MENICTSDRMSEVEAADSSISVSGLTDSVDFSGVSGLEEIINNSRDGKEDSQGIGICCQVIPVCSISTLLTCTAWCNLGYGIALRLL